MSATSQVASVFTVRISHRRLLQMIRDDLESGSPTRVELIAQYLGYNVTSVHDAVNNKQYWDITVLPVCVTNKEQGDGKA